MRLTITPRTALALRILRSEPCASGGRWEQNKDAVVWALSERQVFNGLDPPAAPAARSRLDPQKGAVQ